jgi:DNA-binding NarL/FixJ family response regulator
MAMDEAKATIRVLLADDHAPTRIGVRMALEADGMEIVAEAATADGAVERALEERPDICVLDVRMPGGGTTAARRIAELLPGTAVVMLSVSDAEDELRDALRAGASGYLVKSIDPERLGPALRGVLAGEAAVPRRLVARLLEDYHAAGRGRFARRGAGPSPLTGRERDIAELLRQDRSTSEIAAALGISEVTVRRHVAAVVRKLGVADRQAAVRLLADR